MDGVTLFPLKQIYHKKGDILHALKVSDSGYKTFGEAYFSTICPGCIKGWKKHLKMSMTLIVPVGSIKFVIYQPETKEFFEVTLSRKNYQRLVVSPNLWMAFQGAGEGDNILLNIADLEHDPAESICVSLEEIPYAWQ
jgi:dTDP-4-dehydrorhamnose 3,5-epimerase